MFEVHFISYPQSVKSSKTAIYPAVKTGNIQWFQQKTTVFLWIV